MKMLKKWQLWTIFLVTIIVAVLLIWWNLYATNRTIVTILLVIDFLIMTFALQMAIASTFKYKPKPKHYKKANHPFDVDNFADKLIKNGYTQKSTRFGFGFMKIIGKTAYKIVCITDANEYLKPAEELTEEENKKQKAETPGLSKCTRFVGFEVFLDHNQKVLERLPDFSFQGKNIFYEGFYYDGDTKNLVEVNVIKPDEEFRAAVETLRKDLGVELDVDK